MSDLVSRMSDLLGPAAAEGLRAVGRTFDLMTVAEDEIAKARARLPRCSATLYDGFRYMAPGALADYADDVYRAHVREILRRIAHREDIDSGTLAECLVALSKASLVAPLDADHAAAMTFCFRNVFPGHEVEDAGRESYTGRVAEIVRELRKRLARKRDCS